jgi:hypothetical protein
MASTQEFYGNGLPGNCVRDPRYMPIYTQTSTFWMVASQDTMTSGYPGTTSSTNFWSTFNGIGTVLYSNTSSFTDIINISDSSYPIAVSCVIGPMCDSAAITYMRFTVDDVVYTLDTKHSTTNNAAWGCFDFVSKTYGGSTKYTGSGERFGSEATSYGGGSDGKSYFTRACPVETNEAINRGMPVLVAEHSMRVEIKAANIRTAWPYFGMNQACAWRYLGK